MNLSAQDLNLIYSILLFISGITFLYLRNAWKNFVPELFFWIHFFIVTWSAMMYLNLAYATPLAPYTYYADWTISTPLIMAALGLTSMFPFKNIQLVPVGALMFTQFMVIISGLLADVAADEQSKLVFFVIGNFLMLIIFYLVFGPLKKIANKNTAITKKYNGLSYLLVLFWISYPLVWILGTPGYKILSDLQTNMLLIVLPILCKPVFGFLDLYLLKQAHAQK